MKHVLTTICVVLMTGMLVKAQTNNIGAGLAYGSEIDRVGLGVNAEFMIMPQLSIAPSFNYFLTEKNYYVTVRLWEINGNVHYYFLDNEKMSVYGLGGLNYTKVSAKSNILNYPHSSSSGGLGVNLGGGFKYHLNDQWSPFAELKYVIGDYDQLVLLVGMKLKF